MTESNERHTGWSGACLACGTSWEIHDSPLITCNKLQVEIRNKRALNAYIEKLEARCKRLEDKIYQDREMAKTLRELHDFAEVDSHYRHEERSKAAFAKAAELLKRIGF